MLTLPAQHALTRKTISDIVDRLLSGYKVDAECRILVMIDEMLDRYLKSEHEIRHSLMNAYDELYLRNNTKRAVKELRRWLL